MEAIINSAISELERLEANVLKPFFQNPNTSMGIMIGIGIVGLFYNVSDEVRNLFNNVTYRLIWMLLIVLATLYNPIIGLLTGLCYFMFIKAPKKTENFSDYNSPVTDEEPYSFAQEQLEILENKNEKTHLKRFIESSKKIMQETIEQEQQEQQQEQQQ